MMLFVDDPDFAETEARTELARVHKVLRDIVLSASERVVKLGQDDRWLGKSLEYLALRQHMMNSLVVTMIMEKVANGELPDVEIASDNRFIELKVGSIDMRFKQVDRDGHTANYPTRTSILYNNQLPLWGDFDGPPRKRLTLGWRWNVTATEMEDIVVVYPKGRDIRWQYSILRDADEDGGILAMPVGVPGAPHGTGAGVVLESNHQALKGGA